VDFSLQLLPDNFVIIVLIEWLIFMSVEISLKPAFKQDFGMNWR